jgi:Membrane bound beta barrel domain (DUF5777)
MKKIFIIFILSLFLSPLFAQEEAQAQEKSAPVRFTFSTETLIDNQTVATPYKGGLEMQIQHRFSLIKDIHDLYGIYGSANTRIGLNYGITDRLMIGAGTTKDYKLQDISWKYLFLRQTEDNSTPVSLSYYGNLVIDARNEDAFGPSSDFKQMHRLSYFTQLIIARKFSEKISAQIAPSLLYMNTVKRLSDAIGYKNLNFGLHAGGRANLFGNHSLMLEYDQLLTKQDTGEGLAQPKPNLAFGWEISTATHSFQVFATNYNLIIPQYNLLYNTKTAGGDYMFGFNITVRF